MKNLKDVNKYIIDILEENTKLNLLHFISGLSLDHTTENFIRQCVEYLLSQKGVDVNYIGVVERNYGITAAHIAVQYHNVVVLSMVIDKGADLLICDSYGQNVQDYAEKENDDTISQIVEKGIYKWVETNYYLTDSYYSNLHQKRSSSFTSNFTTDSDVELSSSIEDLLKFTREMTLIENKSSSKLVGDSKNIETPDCFMTPKSQNVTRIKSPESSFVNTRRKLDYEESYMTPQLNPFNVKFNQTILISPEIADLSPNSSNNTKEFSFEKIENTSFDSQATEIYVYKDTENGIELIEERFEPLHINLDDDSFENDNANRSSDSKNSIESIDSFILKLTNSQLYNELQKHDRNTGPVNKKTRKLYERKFHKLRKTPSKDDDDDDDNENVYKLLANYPLHYNMLAKRTFPFDEAIEYETKLMKHFEASKDERRSSKQTFFVYLLLDPRISQNLPSRANICMDMSNKAKLGDVLVDMNLFSSFILSIFYVGKGQSSRAYQHFYEAFNTKNKPNHKTKNSAKVEQIHSIWNSNCGPVSLHCFTGISSDEAFARESLIIDALSLSNLTNKIAGRQLDIGLKKNQRTLLGTYLLFKAFVILLLNGERQIRQPKDCGL